MQDLVETECQKWAGRGININYEIRENRNGYKAGALKEGMKKSYVDQCDYVVIFDADFQPEPDFLYRSVPFLIHNPKLALVQSRWKFGQSILTFYFIYNITLQIRNKDRLAIELEVFAQQKIQDIK